MCLGGVGYLILSILLQDCPEGVVHETAFKDIYAKFFPHGSKFILYNMLFLFFQKLQLILFALDVAENTSTIAWT